MAIRYYDEALWQKISSWMPDNKMRILKVDQTTELFQQRAHMSDDQPITLPFIALSRDSQVNILSTTPKPMVYDGKHVGVVDSKVAQLNAIPIGITYQLDIYTKWAVEGDEYLRNFIFQILNYPKLKIQIPYNGSKIETVSYLKLENTATDNSDIPEKLFNDQFTRWTLRFSIEDAYLFSIPMKDPAEIISEDSEDDKTGEKYVAPILEVQYESRIDKEEI